MCNSCNNTNIITLLVGIIIGILFTNIQLFTLDIFSSKDNSNINVETGKDVSTTLVDDNGKSILTFDTLDNIANSKTPQTNNNIQTVSDNENNTEHSSERLLVENKWNPDSLEREKHCLATNMYFEARNQSKKGKIAVGLVTINRVLSTKYPNTICDVVWQKSKHPANNKWVAQFSWTLDGKSDIPQNEAAWKRSKRLADAMLGSGSLFSFVDFTKGATHYHADYVNPYWTKHMDKTGVYGNHIFYRYDRVAAR